MSFTYLFILFNTQNIFLKQAKFSCVPKTFAKHCQCIIVSSGVPDYGSILACGYSDDRDDRDDRL